MDIVTLIIARKYTDKKISDAIMSIYTLAGSCLFSELPPLTEDYVGFIYSITDDFTTTSDFVEGEGKKFPAGTNVTVVNAGTRNNPVYKYDASIGDLSAFQTKKLDSPISGMETVEEVLDFLEKNTLHCGDDISNYPNLKYTVAMAGYDNPVIESVTLNAEIKGSTGSKKYRSFKIANADTLKDKYYTKAEIDDLLKNYLKIDEEQI